MTDSLSFPRGESVTAIFFSGFEYLEKNFKNNCVDEVVLNPQDTGMLLSDPVENLDLTEDPQDKAKGILGFLWGAVVKEDPKQDPGTTTLYGVGRKSSITINLPPVVETNAQV